MKAAFVLCAILLPSIASAQGLPVTQPSMNGPNHTTWDPAFRGYVMFRSPSVTPTMRRQKLELAKQLRLEVNEMLRVNGGALTAEDQAYVRRKAWKILN